MGISRRPSVAVDVAGLGLVAQFIGGGGEVGGIKGSNCSNGEDMPVEKVNRGEASVTSTYVEQI